MASHPGCDDTENNQMNLSYRLVSLVEHVSPAQILIRHVVSKGVHWCLRAVWPCQSVDPKKDRPLPVTPCCSSIRLSQSGVEGICNKMVVSRGNLVRMCTRVSSNLGGSTQVSLEMDQGQDSRILRLSSPRGGLRSPSRSRGNCNAKLTRSCRTW